MRKVWSGKEKVINLVAEATLKVSFISATQFLPRDSTAAAAAVCQRTTATELCNVKGAAERIKVNNL